ncbi:MAG: endonuclease domain-containing protein [Phenylobacterium sp.]|nr:MAG: endonuclease domain-containing protein [Phenylobacterium sp.]
MFEREGNPRRSVAHARRLRNAMTPAEQTLWRELRKLDAHIRRQAPIGSYVADFACHSRRLVIEVDGELHERLAEVALRDRERSDWLRSQGYTVVRFTNREVEADVSAVVERVKHHLALPLDGEGLGWGEPTALGRSAREALTSRAGLSGAQRPHPTPDPSPSRGGEKTGE